MDTNATGSPRSMATTNTTTMSDEQQQQHRATWYETWELGYVTPPDFDPGQASEDDDNDVGGGAEESDGVVDAICFSCHRPLASMETNRVTLSMDATATSTTSDGVDRYAKNDTPGGLLRCGRCRKATYCGKECQVRDWKQGQHKIACQSYQRIQIVPIQPVDGTTATAAGRDHLATDQTTRKSNPDTQQPAVRLAASWPRSTPSQMRIPLAHHQQEARQELLHRLRFYTGPYLVHQTDHVGPGFLFVQCTDTLAGMSLTIPRDVYGQWLTIPSPDVEQKESERQKQQWLRPYRPRTRSVLMHHLTLGEFDVEVCRDDFELTSCRAMLHQLVTATTTTTNDSQHRTETDYVVLMRFRCGHVAVGTVPLVTPDYAVCRRLGKEYYGNHYHAGAVELHLDDLE